MVLGRALELQLDRGSCGADVATQHVQRIDQPLFAVRFPAQASGRGPEHFERAQDVLLRPLRSRPVVSALLQALGESIDLVFRMAHSIKGMAGSLGYDSITEVAHRMEDRMQAIRSAGRVEAGEEAMTVEAVVMSYVRPALALSKDPARGGAMFVRLFSRVLVENHRQLRETLSRQYGDLVTRYTRALGTVLPGLSEEQVQWRTHLGFSVMFHAFAGNDILKVFGRSAVSARDPDLIVKHVVPFVVAGLTSPPVGRSPGS